MANAPQYPPKDTSNKPPKVSPPPPPKKDITPIYCPHCGKRI